MAIIPKVVKSQTKMAQRKSYITEIDHTLIGIYRKKNSPSNLIQMLVFAFASILVSNNLLAISDNQIVESSVLEQTYLRGGFVSSDGLIKELKHNLQGTS